MRRRDPRHADSVDVDVGAPVVAVDPNVGSSDAARRSTRDNLSGAVTATEHLIELGHRRIGVPRRPARSRVGAAARARLPAGARERPASSSTRRSSASAGSRTRPPRRRRGSCSSWTTAPTAIFAANDVSAIATMRGRALARPRGARRPVGDRVRQRPGVRAQRAAADDDRAADPADGLRGGAAS